MTASEKTIPAPQVAARNGAAIGAAKLTENAPVRIDAHDVDFYYSDFHALKKITMPLYDRRITALIGPSGCGKSTFLRCLNRMNDEIDGTRLVGKITLDNIDINGAGVDKPELRKRIGMVFQKANPFPMSIYDNIAFGPRLHGRPDRKSLDDLVQRCLEQAALWQEVKDKLKASAFALSGGQMQRLCIARTLATQPEVILMDEPTSALDPASTQKIEEMMETLKRDYTIVIVTHNMQQAARISDYTGFFYKGELIEFGSTDRLFTSPQNKQTEDYIRGRFG